MRMQPLVSERRVRSLTKEFWLFLLLGSVVVLFGVGCHRRESAPGVTVTHEIQPYPPRVGPAQITLTLDDPAATPLAHAHVSLEADMAHPGMAPVFADASETAPGRYQGTVNLTMGGDWVVLVHITMPDGKKVERQFEMNGVKSQ